MHIEIFIGFHFDQLIDLAIEYTQITQAFSDHRHGGVIGNVVGRPRSDFGNGLELCLQNNIVNGRLLWTKFAVHGEGARDIGCVIFVLTAGVNQHQITVANFLPVFYVVQNAAIFATANNTSIGRRRRT